ncbi:hypothetical protein L596_022351 [Steinernema carpocapsae]|uniref:Nematode cuticle collagen N-terminal domain-containing protein n=1 Tax=Steinernema carpocapsae TaxID=34508 RepID=A0A4U5MLH0_STECR|nr:hypothetical protein L596_022351 [Steinernema carpocapsae]
MDHHEADFLKRIAFFGVAVSTVATITAIIAVPMLYNYMQQVQMNLQEEVDFCHHRADVLWEEYSRLQRGVGFKERLKRAAYQRSSGMSGRARARGAASVAADEGYGSGDAGVAKEAVVAVQGSCCSCGVGQAGPAGPPGAAGQDGKSHL